MSGAPAPSVHLRHARILIQQGRHAEASTRLEEALARDPDNREALFLLAHALHAQDAREAEALKTIDRAISLEPNDSSYHAARARILSSLSRGRDALACADQAVRLDPYSDEAHVSRAIACAALSRWADSEKACREALAIDPENDVAANLLANALRLQNKMEENAGRIRSLLARDPENEMTHANAGWHALQSGDRETAERHFLEALRLDPNYSYARDGLLQCFRARSPLFRAYLAYAFRMQRLPRQVQMALIIGLFLGFRYVNRLAFQSGNPLLIVAVAAYAVFALWTHVAVPLGNLIILKDRRARNALRVDEKWEAVLCGGAFATGVACVLVNIALGHFLLWVAGFTLIAASIPMAYVLTNTSPLGRAVFGASAAFLLFTGAIMAIGFLFNLNALAPVIRSCLGLAPIVFILSQFLPASSRLHSRRP